MVILKRKFKKKEDTSSLVGVVLPARLATYLTLFCLAHGKTKSSVIKDLLSNWVDQSETEKSFDYLINAIAARSYNIWAVDKEKKMNFNTFKNSLKYELKKKGLAPFSDRILNRLSDEKKENE